ncbi:hypothetical protein ACIBL8_47655 [Streptomyces sp. NPDC050523]|uniref:hypothetical protein n=1 Tax=Streptomyces sp. NPDC050523 TaxID=3365622 RepID=UPI0037A17783
MLFVIMLAGILEFQRDMISENAKEGVAAAEASGKTFGPPPSVEKNQAADAMKAYREDAAVEDKIFHPGFPQVVDDLLRGRITRTVRRYSGELLQHGRSADESGNNNGFRLQGGAVRVAERRVRTWRRVR